MHLPAPGRARESQTGHCVKQQWGRGGDRRGRGGRPSSGVQSAASSLNPSEWQSHRSDSLLICSRIICAPLGVRGAAAGLRPGAPSQCPVPHRSARPGSAKAVPSRDRQQGWAHTHRSALAHSTQAMGQESHSDLSSHHRTLPGDCGRVTDGRGVGSGNQASGKPEDTPRREPDVTRVTWRSYKLDQRFPAGAPQECLKHTTPDC